MEEMHSGVVSAHKDTHGLASVTFPQALFQLWTAGAAYQRPAFHIAFLYTRLLLCKKKKCIRDVTRFASQKTLFNNLGQESESIMRKTQKAQIHFSPSTSGDRMKVYHWCRR